MGKLKLMTILGTRPEIIRLSEVIKAADRYFDHVLVHTGQNFDYTLNQVFFENLGLREPDHYLDSVGADLGETMGNIISKSYSLMTKVRPDAVLILGDTTMKDGLVPPLNIADTENCQHSKCDEYRNENRYRCQGKLQ